MTGRFSWRAHLKPGRVALLPADKLQFVALCDALARALGELSVIEEEIQRGAANRASDPRSRALWAEALLAGREPELAGLRQAADRMLRALQEFAESCGYRSAEQLARACGLPSPGGPAGAP